MSNAAVDVQSKGDSETQYVVDELESDMAYIGWVQTNLRAIARAQTVTDMKTRITDLDQKLQSKYNALRAELMRLRQPDS